jgi:ABC-type uncharacterized transport system substrate-binding protein
VTLPAGHARHLVDRCTLGLTEHCNHHVLLRGAGRVAAPGPATFQSPTTADRSARRGRQLSFAFRHRAARSTAAQQKAMPVIGFLGAASPGPNAPYVGAFHQGLGDTGYVEGQNVAIEYRWAEGQYDRLPALAADLVSRKVDVILASGGDRSALAAKDATSTIPIVFTGVSDPVGYGLVASFSRPGGNVTGMSPFSDELNVKRIELLSELAPQAVIGLLVNPHNAAVERTIRNAQEAEP